MGVPKFFRWISERYPTLSELVKNYQIPEFDNLYLDMNGIIHVCSHPNDFDPHFRITEEKIFQDIFNYIETLFKMIQPRKLFFMAVDGVAPRAKMNQQRGRRFRSAKEAEILEKKAREKGEKLPNEARFDSNCITPGTAFMARLQEQLKYFVARKVSTDPLWLKIRVILSGHNTPGEGEHKIMDYIRYMKSQPDYDPNTRHCLYGLDADLIMLGMCTHEPYFCLLREEVKFGRRNQQHRLNSAENINFYLLHLSLLRDYLSMEFSALKGKINFPWDLERIIDDWVLMGFLVGNDFIPPLPDMHIASGALPMLYKAYIEVLPSLGGYIQESGHLNLHRFEAYLQYLSKFDVEHFKDINADIKYMESKTGRRREAKNIRDEDLNELINSTLDILSESDASSNDDEYDDRLFRQQFYCHKADYYVNKLAFESMTPKVLRDQTRVYLEAIQWNLHYYYHGVCSWSWFYPHHYAPYVSDIRDFGDLELHYDIGQPFRPFEQLLAVLPAGSRDLLPEPYQKLMTEQDSPIIDYYPSEFRTDLNGKQQQWEAVVLIPFIEEDSLLKAMLPIEDHLKDEEKERNSQGPMLEFHRDPEPQGIFIAPEFFPTIDPSFAKIRPITREQLFVPQDELIKGLCPGVNLDLYSKGFPTLRHIAHSGRLKKAKVKVFDQPSRGENMIIEVKQSTSTLSLAEAAKRLLGNTVWVGWPHLQEALVTAVADANELLSEVPMPFSPKEWSLQKQSLREESSNRSGIELGEVRILVYTRPMIGRRYTTIGQRGRITLEKQWTIGNVPYPLQVVIPELPVINDKIPEYSSIHQIFPVGSDVFLLSPELYGVQGEVIPTKEKNKICVQANIPYHPNLDLIRELQQRYLNSFVTGQEAARRVGTTPFLLSRLTGTIYAQSDSDKKTNLGLNLKFNRRNEEVVGFTRKENNAAWLYSKDCVNICKDYVDKFPEVVKCLSKHSSEDVLAESEVFENRERLQEAVTWLRGLPCAIADRVPCGTELLCFDGIQELERIITNSDAEWRKKTPVIKRVHVQPSHIFRPELQMGQVPPDPTAQYRLLDRVNVVGIKFASSLGQFGTVIAVRRHNDTSLCDLILDNGIRCNSLPPWSMINLSFGRRLSQPPTLQTNVHPSSWNNNMGAHNNNHNVQKTQTPPSSSGIPNTMHLHPPPQPAFQILQRPQHNNQAAQSTVVLRQLLKIGSPSTSTTLAPQANSLANPNSSAISQNKPRPRLNLPPPPPQQWVQTKGDQRPRGQQFHSNPSNNKTPVSPNEARFVPLQAIRAQQRKRENQQIPSDAQNPLIPVEAAPSCAPISLAAAATTQFNPTPSTSPPSNPQTTESSSHQGNIPVKNSQSPKNKSSSNNSTQPNVVRKRRPRIAANFSQKFVD